MHMFLDQYKGNTNPYATGPRRAASVLHTQSLLSKSSDKLPALPPPNKNMNDSLAEQLRGL